MSWANALTNFRSTRPRYCSPTFTLENNEIIPLTTLTQNNEFPWGAWVSMELDVIESLTKCERLVSTTISTKLQEFITTKLAAVFVIDYTFIDGLLTTLFSCLFKFFYPTTTFCARMRMLRLLYLYSLCVMYPCPGGWPITTWCTLYLTLVPQPRSVNKQINGASRSVTALFNNSVLRWRHIDRVEYLIILDPPEKHK